MNPRTIGAILAAAAAVSGCGVVVLRECRPGGELIIRKPVDCAVDPKAPPACVYGFKVTVDCPLAK